MQIENPPVSSWHRARVLVLRWLIITMAIFAAIQLVPGISFVGPGWQLGIIAMIFGIVNIAIRPLLTLLTCSLVLLTFGLFNLVINAVLLLLTAQIADLLNIQFTINDFWAAFLGGLVISIVTLVLSWLAGDAPGLRVIVEKRQGEG